MLADEGSGQTGEAGRGLRGEDARFLHAGDGKMLPLSRVLARAARARWVFCSGFGTREGNAGIASSPAITEVL